jgi:hypothetical protein
LCISFLPNIVIYMGIDHMSVRIDLNDTLVRRGFELAVLFQVYVRHLIACLPQIVKA